MNRLENRLRAIAPDILKGMLRGIEREGLRATPDGMLAKTPHPARLGSPLTHPHITTDFSESQLELITGVLPNADACENELTEIHQVVYRQIGEELLWCTSMPCRLPPDDDIPVGQYGSSNVGRTKTVYRLGLSHRYGRRMQTVSGIHYNFSLPEAAWPMLQQADNVKGSTHTYRNDAYFSLIRNFRRRSWLLLYLFGASPAVCRSFVAGRPHRLIELEANTLYLPYGTSLRMSPLGYQSHAQASLRVSYNDLKSYADSLNRALTEPYPPYEAIGIGEGDDYRQLSTTLLQIENEFYGTIRPKRRILTGERPLRALSERGVEYVEVRCMDVDPFVPTGITAGTMRFLDVFLLHCLLSDSPADTPENIAAHAGNQQQTAERGRDPELRLNRLGEEITLAAWGHEVLRECEPIAATLDELHGGASFRDALSAARAVLDDPGQAPSARVLAQMRAGHGGSHLEFALDRSQRHRRELLERPLAQATAERFATMAEESLAERRAIEAADRIPFETYRRRYILQDLLRGPQRVA